MDYVLRKAAQSDEKTIKESWGSLTWVASKDLTDSEGITFGRVIIKKGEANPRHLHPNCEEVLYLLRGKLEHSIGDEKVVMEPGDTIVIRPHQPHHAVNIGDEDADMIVACTSGNRKFELE